MVNKSYSGVPLMTSSERRFFDSHKGFAPYENPPSELGRWLQALVDYRRGNHQGGIYIDTSQEGRPVYHTTGPEELVSVRESLASCGIYNSPVSDNGGRYNVDIFDGNNDFIIERARDTLRSRSVRVLLPFAGESNTIADVIRYAGELVGIENVLAIDAGTQEAATYEARRTGARVADQKEVLRYVDWAQLKRLEIVPPKFPVPPRGSKGMTVYAGLVALESTMNLYDTSLVMHDTDIVNPGHSRRNGQHPEYHALEHLAIPLAYPVGDVHGVNLLKTGEGRNNEPWFAANNLICASSEDDDMVKLTTLLGTLGWPLSGERLLSGKLTVGDGVVDLTRHMHLATGMGVETGIDVYLTGVDVRGGARYFMQTANPNPKIENYYSPRDREYALITNCALFLTDISRQIERRGRLFHEWKEDDISDFNGRYGGRIRSISVPNPNDHHGNVLVDVTSDYVLPSMEMLRALDVVDWESVRHSVKS